jgi:hypothetical protein
MTKMVAQYTQQGGKTMEQTMAWAVNELEGFMRT